MSFSYLEQFMQQWKVYLKQHFKRCGLSYVEVEGDDQLDIKANSLTYFACLRTTSQSIFNMDESRDELAWIMLEKQLKALAKKAEIGASNLVSKLYIEETQILIRLNFSYDNEQHIIYVG
ncbi:hypothetical protein V6259_00900 [Marinomonas sp. TI.3.20]|uniref:hypothetical protein n=1 Tax=Marinomonas sp. TI.3.20 TaxID=3121296 RepID=UPI00312018A8